MGTIKIKKSGSSSAPIREGAAENKKIIDDAKKRSTVEKASSVKIDNTVFESTMFNLSIAGEEKEPNRILLVGNSKSGRSFLAASFPKPVFINIDKGLQGLKGKNILSVNIAPGGKTHSEIYDVLTAIEGYKDVFSSYRPETLVIDDISGMSELFETEVKYYDRDEKNIGKDGLFLNEYNIVQCRIIDIFNFLKAMQSVKYIVVLSSASLIYSENDDGTYMFPATTGQKFCPRVPTYFGEVYQCFFNTDQKSYQVRTAPSKMMPYLGTRYYGVMPEIIDNPKFEKLNTIYEKGIKIK